MNSGTIYGLMWGVRRVYGSLFSLRESGRLHDADQFVFGREGSFTTESTGW